MKGSADMNKKIETIVILFVLVIFLVPTSVAILKRRANSNSSLASAAWAVTLEQNGVDNDLTVVPGTSNDTYTLNVKSLSEVDVKYSIVLSNLPSGIEASIDGVTFPPVSNGTVTFYNAGTILYSSGEKTNTHTLTFRGTSVATPINNHAVTVKVVAEQMTTN